MLVAHGNPAARQAPTPSYIPRHTPLPPPSPRNTHRATTHRPQLQLQLQVTQVFARRGYNVQSLAVGPSERDGTSRICMVVPGKSKEVSHPASIISHHTICISHRCCGGGASTEGRGLWGRLGVWEGGWW